MVKYKMYLVNAFVMRIGAHISAAGGLWNAPLNAAKLGLECFQFFSRPPQGGRISTIADDVAEKFISLCKEHDFANYYIHAPYIVNLASKEERIRNNTVEIIRGELDRGTVLKARAMMTHLGSASSIGDPVQGVKLTIEGIRRILDGYEGATQLLLEISAGAGMVIGARFEEMAEILEGVGDDSLIDHREGLITVFFKHQELDLGLAIVLLNTSSLDITTDANSSTGKLLLHLESL